MEINGETSNTDSLLMDVGGCGRFQAILTAKIMFTSITSVFSYCIVMFNVYNPGWRCLDNVTDTNTGNVMDSIIDNVTLKSSGSFTSFANNRSTQSNISFPEYQTESCQDFSSCHHIEFNPDSSTLVSELALTCDRSWILSTIISINMAGGFFSTLIIGYISDNYGRKITMYVSILFIVILNICIIFATSWQMFAAMLFLLGAAGEISLIGFVLNTEYVTFNWRMRLKSIPFWNGYVILFAVIAMYTRDRKLLRLIGACIGAVGLLTFFWVPKSLRWLSVRGKEEEALEVVKKIAKVNKADMPDDERALEILNQNFADEKKVQRSTIFHLFRKGYIVYTIIVGFLSLVTDMVYYTFSLGVATLPGNMYVNLIVFALCDLPANVCAFSIANRYSRKRSSFTCFITASLFLFIVVALDQTTSGDVKVYGIIASVMASKLFLYIAWLVMITAVLEIYPTVVRGNIFSYQLSMSNVGGIIAPYLIPREPSTFYICYTITACLLAACALSISFLPETKGKPLYDTWEDAKKYEDKKNGKQQNQDI